MKKQSEVAMDILIPGFGYVDLDEIQSDVNAAKEKGFSQKWAFTPETVQGLIDKIKQINEV